VFAGAPARVGRRVAVVGLGVGAIACYRAPGDDWRFYEIDPAVERLARNPAYFSFLSQCAPQAPVVIGDARLSLERAPRRNDLLILDAYSSDHVPVHLVTREALQVYLANLAPEGILAFHISNRYFDLAPVLANAASDAGLRALVRDEGAIGRRDEQRGKAASEWLVMARDERAFGALANDLHWSVPAPRRDLPLWTDDYSSLVRVLRK
jgi:SAM-dependent methyltransferase